MATPTCAVCGAKFSFDRLSLTCNKCGAPAEVSELNKADLRRYKIGRKMELAGTSSKRATKRAMHEHPSRRYQRRPKHGRQVRVAA